MMYGPKWTNGKCDVGDAVVVTGEVSEYQGVTQLNKPSAEKYSCDTCKVEPITLTTKDMHQTKDTSEPYEGMLVTMKDLTVVVANPDAEKDKNYGETVVKDSAGGEMIIDQNVYHDKGLLDDTMPVGSTFESVTGVIHYHYGKYKLLVRTADDIVGFKTPTTTTKAPIKVDIPEGTPVLTIAEAQTAAAGSEKDESQHKGKMAVMYGVISAAFGNSDTQATWAFIQNGTSTRSGIMLFRSKWTNGKCEVGDKVMVYGKVGEYDSATQVASGMVVKLSSGNTITPTVLTTKDMHQTKDTSEPYEGMLVTMKDLTVVVANPDAEKDKNYGETVVKDSAGGEMIIDQNVYHDKGLLDDTMPVGSTFESVTGVIHYHYGKYKLLVRTADDIVGFKAAAASTETTKDPLSNAFEETIRNLQLPTDKSKAAGHSPKVGTAVTVYGIVVADFGGSNKSSSWTYIQNGTETHSGVMVYQMSPKPAVGDKVKLTGVVEEFEHFTDNAGTMTQLGKAVYEVIGTGNALPAYTKVTAKDLQSNVTGEQFESMLVYLEDVEVVNANPSGPDSDYGEMVVKDASGGEAVVDGEVNDACGKDKNCVTEGSGKREVGAKFSRVQGVVHWHRGAFKILMFDKNGAQGYTAAPPTTAAPPKTGGGMDSSPATTETPMGSSTETTAATPDKSGATGVSGMVIFAMTAVASAVL